MPDHSTQQPSGASPTSALDERAVERRFADSRRTLHETTDRFFARLLLAQWLTCILIALVASPFTWEGQKSELHLHVWMAVILGAAITLYPAWRGLKRSGSQLTRHLLAAAPLLIHLTGGRIETHFHVFGSLAFIAFYRDIPVLLTATVVVAVDHLLRGIYLPESVYGVFLASPWRTVEHAFWVVFEVAFLTVSTKRSLAEMRQVARRQISLEDINEEMEAAVSARTAEMQASEERYRLLFKDAPVGLYRAAPEGTLLLANPLMLQMLGYATEEEMRAAGVSFRGETNGERAELLGELLQAGDVQSMDLTWRRRDGSTVFVHESIKIARGPTGEIVSFEGSVEDITERRQLEERYLQAQKVQAIGQLAGGIAHDFNNILTAILGYSDMLLENSALDRTSGRQVEEIKKASERAASLTQQLLAFSRKQTLQPRILQLNAVVGDMDKMLRRLVGEHILFQTRLAPDLITVRADPGQLQQVLMNLVVNARDAMPGGGRLTIETFNITLDAEYCRLHPEAHPGDYIMLAVSDDGVGMPPEVQTRVFEPFFTTKDVGVGTGLGLSTCHGIVKQSGGHIGIYSEIGFGTTFRIYLPGAHGVVEESRPQAAPGEMCGGRETILLVEDEPMVRELGVLALSSLGYHVLEASNGLEAIRRFELAGPDAIDLLVTDVVMPEMGGRELARQVRALSPEVRILFSSGYTYDAIERTDLLEQGTYFLPKPYTMAVLAAKVREVLDTPAAMMVAA